MAQTRRMKLLILCVALASTKAVAQDNSEQLALGEEVFNTWCLACHDANLPWSGGGTQALDAKYEGELPGNLLDRTDLTEDVVKAFVRTGIYRMPPFRLTEIDDTELDALAAFLARDAGSR